MPKLQQSSVSASNNPLVAQYSVTTSGQGTVAVEFGPTTSYGFQTGSQSLPAAGGTVNIQVAGMKQNTLYHMRAVLTSSAGQVLDQDRTFQTGAIPPSLIPSMQLTIPPGQTPTPGVQLISGAGPPFAFAMNPAWDIVWYYNYQGTSGGPWLVKLLDNGNMLMILNYPGTDSSGIREVDLAGNIVREVDLLELGNKLQSAGYNPITVDRP
jgi:arylsulfate sulfotransferase